MSATDGEDFPLRFVVLRHERAEEGESHFDLLFETSPGSQLLTFRSPVWPINGEVEVTRLRDHRRLYLDYEGPIAGGRGEVHRVDIGRCRVQIGSGGVFDVEFELPVVQARLKFRQVNQETWIAFVSEA